MKNYVYSVMRSFVVLCLVTQLCLTLCNPMNCNPPGSFVRGDSLGKNTGMGCHALLQGIVPTQGSDPGLLHCRWVLYPLSHQGSPRILEWVVYPFCRGTSQPKNWTRISCIVGSFLISWVTWEALTAFERKWKSFSHVWFFATPWTIQSVELSRPEYWSG